MKFLVVSNAPLVVKNDHYYAYSPYEKEMKIWAKYVDQIAFCCPKWTEDKGLLVSKVAFSVDSFFELKEFNVKSIFDIFKAFFWIPINFCIIFKAMLWADHIHLRCPGNIGLLASIAQLFFPWKVKTVKYAGNWDPASKTPLAYKWQKNILSSTFLSKKVQVLVYGEWKNSSKNIKPFFTASYHDSEKVPILERKLNGVIQFMFVGMLTEGKRPLYALKLAAELYKSGQPLEIYFFGEGNQRPLLESYIKENNLEKVAFLKGNQKADVVKEFFQKSHFVLLPSKSEGWPKVIAEGMFWGCVPIATSVSCVPFMLDVGERGILLKMDYQEDLKQISQCLQHNETYCKMSRLGADWSRKYTLDYFESEIKLLLQR